MKKLLSLAAIMILIIGSMFALTGCGSKEEKKDEVKNANTTEVSYVSGKLKYTVSVPKKDDGSAKYEFTTEKPEVKNAKGSFFIETENAVIGFSTSGLVYTTSTYYKDKYGADQKATFDGFMNWVNDPASKITAKDYTQVEVNGRKAYRLDLREGSSGNYKYKGYNYMVAADDVLPGSYIQINVNFKGDEELTSQKELDSETQDIINSLVVVANN